MQPPVFAEFSLFAPGRIRNPVLYPPELRGRLKKDNGYTPEVVGDLTRKLSLPASPR